MRSSFIYVLFGILIGSMLILGLLAYSKSIEPEYIKVSLPEEIGQAKAGDLLEVKEVNDSIYIEFKRKIDREYNIELINQTDVRIQTDGGKIYNTQFNKIQEVISKDNL